jgi:hypothetical protein
MSIGGNIPSRCDRHRTLLFGIALGAILIALVGCSHTELPTESSSPLYPAGASIPFLSAVEHPSRSLLRPESDPALSWNVVAQATVKPEDKNKSVKGSRYELIFPLGSVQQPVQITISELTPNTLELQLGEHGLVFQKPVMLRIDYSGTNADPGSKLYDGSKPEFYWFNPVSLQWEKIPGADDPKAKKYTIQLWHFSLYGLIGDLTEGTANW